MTRKPGINFSMQKESKTHYIIYIITILAIALSIIAQSYFENNKSPEAIKKQIFEKCIDEAKTTGISQRELTPEIITACSNASNK